MLPLNILYTFQEGLFMLFIFDMGGVVTNTSTAEIKIAELLDINLDDFKKLIKPHFSDLTCGKITQKEFWNIISGKTGKQIETDLWNFFFHPKLNDGTVKIISELKKKHRVICGTNTIENHYLRHIERGDYTIFDETYCSHKLGVEKPDPKFWKYILLSENEKPANTVFIDDKIENIKAAEQLNIKAYLFTDETELREKLKEYL